MIHTIQFSKVVFWDTTGIVGVKFVNTTTPETATVNSVIEASGTSDILSYDVTWVTDPVEGDKVQFEYIPGEYKDDNDTLMSEQILPLVNCLDSQIPANALLETTTLEALLETGTGEFLLET